jgi:hypothetical protein
MKKILNNQFLELNLILFPIWILPVYLGLKSFFISPELAFLLFLIIFGESHFASTFLFFFNKPNHNYIKKNKLILIYIPIFLSLFYFLGGLNYFDYAVLIGAVASGIHVTRQSIGISRIFSEGKNIASELLIYFSSFLFLFIGFTRFYKEEFFGILAFLPDSKSIVDFYYGLLEIKLFFIFLIIFLCLLAILEKVNYKKKLVNLTGVLIYSPYIFVNNIYDAIVIGVGAHWSQYLLINYKIYFYKEKINLEKSLQMLFIITYAFLMGVLGYKIHFNEDFLKILILIPLTGQFFHYYVDAFIWRFSIKEIRETVGVKLFSS